MTKAAIRSLACHTRADEGLTYYEIDPEVTRIARDASKFRFLSECAPGARVVLGDARLTLAGETRRFDLIVLDAFSSDVIPVHLLTREAMAMYLDRLAPGGVIALHISNRYLELASVTRDVASSVGLATFLKRDMVAPSARGEDMRMSALVAVVARSKSDLAPLGAREGWTEAPFASTGRAWTSGLRISLVASRVELEQSLTPFDTSTYSPLSTNWAKPATGTPRTIARTSGCRNM